jgi:hypothetical protein
MSTEDLSKRYHHLLDLSARVRSAQVHYYRYRTEKERLKALERQLDNLLRDEFKRINSKQIEIG